MRHTAGRSAASPDAQLGGTGVVADVAASGPANFSTASHGDDPHAVALMAIRRIKRQYARHAGSASVFNRSPPLHGDAAVR